MQNIIDSFVIDFRRSILEQYDMVCANNEYDILSTYKENLTEEELMQVRMGFAFCIVCSQMLNKLTIEQLHFLRKKDYLLF